VNNPGSGKRGRISGEAEELIAGKGTSPHLSQGGKEKKKRRNCFSSGKKDSRRRKNLRKWLKVKEKKR